MTINSDFPNGYISEDARMVSCIQTFLNFDEIVLTMAPCYELQWETVEYGGVYRQRVQKLHSFECVITNKAIRTFIFEWRQTSNQSDSIFKVKAGLKAFREIAKQRSNFSPDQFEKEMQDSMEINLLSQNEISITSLISNGIMTVTPRSLFFAANNQVDPGGKVWAGFFDAWGLIDSQQTLGMFTFNNSTQIEILSGHEGIFTFPEAIAFATQSSRNTSSETPRPIGAKERLSEISNLLENGLITEEEFEDKKRKIIDEI